MADVSKLKQKPRRLGAPPAVNEASDNLTAPEVAPVAPAPAPVAVVAAPKASARRDGRSMRRTGRTVTFATRVSQEFDSRVREIAEQEGLMLVEVLEHALAAYERENHKR